MGGEGEGESVARTARGLQKEGGGGGLRGEEGNEIKNQNQRNYNRVNIFIVVSQGNDYSPMPPLLSPSPFM